ncbi:M23 family metallopeptidase [uncultured Desulfuromusa sp.]|uniref:M23 family metallopeptidase n=1 Tax=uncultured Desulfuromusa sp. TaxID=219183 RepID=UPI002AA6FE2D|nr:M23 family metallopeptidase [uncultured Desulfuromusa sp.]
MAKRFSIIVIPEGGSKVSSFHLRSGFVKFAICCSLVVVGLSAFFAYKYFNFKIDYAELQRLRVSTIEQHQTLLSLTADLKEVHQQMDDLAESEARVRQLADLESLPEDVPVAIGGIQELEVNDDVDEIQRQINKLQVAIELRRQSQEGVRNLLNDQVSLSRATPKGWPTKGWLTSYFGMRKSPFTGRRVMHEGLDIAANTGTPVTATADGIVSRVKYSPDYGKMVIIDHGYGYRTIFAHNSKVLVKAGQRIKRGDVISQVGNTGRSTGSHLHYELRLNGVPIDPRKTL